MAEQDYSAHTFLWYDYETFGTRPQHDRIAQFAAQRTDINLKPIGEPINLYCQPALDYLPQPEACLLTGITPQICQQRGLLEKDFADQIVQQMSQPNTISVGYNSIRFDDEFSRFLFWRNLIEPYSREWRNGCGRWDLLDVVRLTYALRPQGINWPTDEQGLPSFKLEKLTQANQLNHVAAHDALSDVFATIALARLIKQQQTKLFDFALQLHKKKFVSSQLAKPDNSAKAFIHVSGQFPRQQGCLAVMYPLANNPHNNNEVIAWNLAHDPSELFQLSASQIQQRLFTKTADLPADTPRLPIKGVHLNKSPMVIGNLKLLTNEILQKWQLDPKQITTNLAKLTNIPDMSTIWHQVYQPALPTEPVVCAVESALYAGFLSEADQRRLAKLKQLEAAELALNESGFDDERLSELVFHYQARNYPQSLTATQHQRWQQYCQAKLMGGAFGALTIAQFTDQLDELQQRLDIALDAASISEAFYQQRQEILEQLYDWCSQLGENL